MHCPNRPPRAVSQTKTHQDTAISQPPANSQAVLETIFHSNTARIPHHWQCRNQPPPTALPNLPNTSTHRQCRSTINNSPLPPCTLRSHHQHNQAPSRKISRQLSLLRNNPTPVKNNRHQPVQQATTSHRPAPRAPLQSPHPPAIAHKKRPSPRKPQGLGQILYLC